MCHISIVNRIDDCLRIGKEIALSSKDSLGETRPKPELGLWEVYVCEYVFQSRFGVCGIESSSAEAPYCPSTEFCLQSSYRSSNTE